MTIRLTRQRVLFWLLIPLSLLGIVVLFWLPFDLKLGVLLEPWGLMINMDQNAPLFIGFDDTRPLPFLIWHIIYTFEANSFVVANLAMLLIFWGKGLMLYALVRKILPPHPLLAWLVAVLFITFPAETALFWVGATNVHSAVLLLLLSVYLMIRLWEAETLRAQILFATAMLGALNISLMTYEVGHTLAYIAPAILIYLEGGRLTKRVLWIAFIWYLPVMFLATQLYPVIFENFDLPNNRYNDFIDRNPDQSGLLVDMLQSIFNMVIYHFLGSWQAAIEHLREFMQQRTFVHLTMIAIGAALTYCATFWQGRQPITASQQMKRRTLLIVLFAGLTILLVAFVPFLPSKLRHVTERTFYYNSIGSALVLGTVLYVISQRLPFRKIVLSLVVSVMVGLGITRALHEHQNRINLSHRQQSLLAAIVEQIPAVHPDSTFILIAEGEDLHLQTGFIDGFNVFGIALEYIYESHTTEHAWLNSRKGCMHLVNTPRNQCKLQAEGLLFYPDEDPIPYERVIALEFGGIGRIHILDEIPEKFLPEGIVPEGYDPSALIDTEQPYPERVHTLFVEWKMPSAHTYWTQTSIPTPITLIDVEDNIAEMVKVNPVVQTPYWGIEEYNADSYLWLGHGMGNEGGLGFELWSDTAQEVNFEMILTPGPAREDMERTLSIIVKGKDEEATVTYTIYGQLIPDIPVPLFAGYNQIEVTVLDEPTIAIQPNGDPRPLLVRLDGITVSKLE